MAFNEVLCDGGGGGSCGGETCSNRKEIVVGTGSVEVVVIACMPNVTHNILLDG